MAVKSEKKESPTPKGTKVVSIEPKLRWVKNAFFEGGWTKNIRLDEIRNHLNRQSPGQGDMSDEQLSEEILRRAGLIEHARYQEIKTALTTFFASIPDPAMQWVNPNYGKHFPKNVEPK